MAVASSCPRPGRPFVNRKSGQVLVPGCGTLACPYCGPRRALSTVYAIVLARPNGSGVVTMRRGPVHAWTEVRLAYQEAARALSRIASEMRNQGVAWEQCWVLELSERLIPNVHVLARSPRPDRVRFRKAAIGAGMGWADLWPIRYPGRLARYVLKLPLTPLDAEPDDPAGLLRLHLDLNGGRLVTSTRGFWLDRRGRSVPGLRMARLEARIARSVARRYGTPTAWRAGWKIPPVDRLV